MNRKINYIHEPDDLQCGQAVLAMLLDTTPEEIARRLDNSRETTLKEMKLILRENNIPFDETRRQAQNKSELPDTCILSLETPRCWHWSLYSGGVFYDPEHGVMEDFPVCGRKYYWEIYPQ